MCANTKNHVIGMQWTAEHRVKRVEAHNHQERACFDQELYRHSADQHPGVCADHQGRCTGHHLEENHREGRHVATSSSSDNIGRRRRKMDR